MQQFRFFFRPDISILRWDEIFSDRMQERGGGGRKKGGKNVKKTTGDGECALTQSWLEERLSLSSANLIGYLRRPLIARRGSMRAVDGIIIRAFF